jgi:hypothetical protein
MTTPLHEREYTVRLTSLGAMLDELQAIFAAKGCRLTEMSVTFYPSQDCEGQAPDDDASHQPVTIADNTRRVQCL